jgi:hypothetical protein
MGKREDAILKQQRKVQDKMAGERCKSKDRGMGMVQD